MIYTVAIGNNLITQSSSISRVRTLDESYDFASLILDRELVIDAKPMKEVVTITVNDGINEIRSYYFLITSDNSSYSDSNREFTTHELTLSELTLRLGDYTVGYRKYTDNTKTDFQVLENLLSTLFFREEVGAGSSRLLNIDLTHPSLDNLKSGESRDYQFDNSTLLEAVERIFNENGGMPRIIFEDGVYKLTLELKNERKSLREILTVDEKTPDYVQTGDITKYATTSESYTNNQAFDKTRLGASTVEPSSNGFMPVISESEPFDSDTSFIRTRYNIREIVKVEVELEDISNVKHTVDITKRVIAEERYRGLKVGDTSFEQIPSTGQNVEIGESIGVTPTQKIGTLYFKDNEVINFFTIFGATVWSRENYFYIVNACSVAEDKEFLVDNVEYQNIRMRVTYIPQFDSVLHAEKYNTDTVNKYTMMQSNQNASVVSTETVLKTTGAEINAYGNNQIVTTHQIDDLTNEWEVGDFTEDNFIISRKEVFYFQDYILVKYQWDKDYQKRNEDIEIKSELQLYAIPSSGISPRQLYYKEYIYVGFNTTSETTLMNNRAKQIALNIFEQSITTRNDYNQSIQNALVTNEDVLTTINPILLPVISVGGRNVLNFNFGFDSPNVAGLRLDTTSQSIPLLEPVLYTDDGGLAETINFELIDTADVNDPTTLPLIPYADRNQSLVGSIFTDFLIKKDAAEQISFSYQIHMIPNTNIVLGDYLVTRNNLIETRPSDAQGDAIFDPLVVYSSSEYYTPQETKRAKGTVATGVAVTKPDSFSTIGISQQINNAAWAIATTSGELVLAVNQFDSLQTTVKFNYYNERFDIDYDFLGETISSPPDAPSDLIITTISDTELQLDWTDNATNETYFLIEISEDDVNYNVLDTVDVNVVTYNAINLDAGTRYYFRVSSYNQGGTNGSYASGDGTTAAAPSLPGVPTNYVVTAQDSDKLTGSWSAGSGAVSYDIGIKKNSEPDTAWVDINISGLLQTYQWTGLDASTLYNTRIRSRNAQGVSSYVTFNKSTNSSVQTTARPDINVTQLTTESITFRVTNNDASIVTIKADRQVGTSGDQTPDLRTVTGVDSFTTITFTDLQPDTFYTLTATAQASGEEVSSVDSVTTKTEAVQNPPSAPSTLDGVGAAAFISLTWDDVTDEDGYTIEFHANSSFTNEIKTVTKNANDISHFETTIADGTYWVRIRAFNANGTSAWRTCNDNPLTKG